MIRFYDVDSHYADYLRTTADSKVPYISYGGRNNKFLCGVVLDINGVSYYAPVSSCTKKYATSILISDDKGDIKSSIRFCFMFPAPPEVLHEKVIADIRRVDPTYADLLDIEYEYCRNNENRIYQKAYSVYKIGCNPGHACNQFCCNFPELEKACSRYRAPRTATVPILPQNPSIPT